MNDSCDGMEKKYWLLTYTAGYNIYTDDNQNSYWWEPKNAH